MLRPFCVVLTLSLSLPAVAGEVAEHALSAEAALEAERPIDAMDAIETAVDRVWSAAPLVFRRSLFAMKIEGFGRYEPRGEARFYETEAQAGAALAALGRPPVLDQWPD